MISKTRAGGALMVNSCRMSAIERSARREFTARREAYSCAIRRCKWSGASLFVFGHFRAGDVALAEIIARREKAGVSEFAAADLFHFVEPVIEGAGGSSAEDDGAFVFHRAQEEMRKSFRRPRAG